MILGCLSISVDIVLCHDVGSSIMDPEKAYRKNYIRFHTDKIVDKEYGSLEGKYTEGYLQNWA